jgi:predicted neuraminidase
MNVKLYLFCLLLIFSNNPSQAQEWKDGMITDEFVFESAPFPESHAATIAETPKGLISAWFGGTKERNPDVGIWVSHHENGVWTAPVEVANGIINDTLRYACWNPVLFQIPGDDLLLFYKVGPNVAGWKAYVKRSKDHGKTWSLATQLPDGLIGPVKNKPVLLSDGSILSPSSTEGNGWNVHFERSEDKGQTWAKTAEVNSGRLINSIQPSILVHVNGDLQILCRSKDRMITTAHSTDLGMTWSPMQLTNLPNNNSGTDAVTLADGRHVVVYNHVKTPENEKKGARTPLNLAISQDGINWQAALVLEDSPISQYSYPSVIQSKDGMLHVVYTWRRQRIKYVKIDPSKLKTKPILEEKWPL